MTQLEKRYEDMEAARLNFNHWVDAAKYELAKLVRFIEAAAETPGPTGQSYLSEQETLTALAEDVTRAIKTAAWLGSRFMSAKRAYNARVQQIEEEQEAAAPTPGA